MNLVARIATSLLLTACAAQAGEPETCEETRAAPLYRPASAQAALVDVLGVLEQIRAEGSWIEPTSILAWARDDHVDIRMELTIRGADDVAASRLYGRLIDELEAAPWTLEVGRSSTDPLPAGDGLHVDSLEVSVASTPIECDGARSAGLEALIREVCVRPEISLGPMSIDPSSKQPDRTTLDRRWRIRPVHRTGSDIDRILAFANGLEQAGSDQNVVVTQLELNPSNRSKRGESVTNWLYQLETTVRERAL